MRSLSGTKAAVVSVSLVTASALGALVAVPGTALADGPSAIMSFRSASVSPDTNAVMAFIVSGEPYGSTIYLQLDPASGGSWKDVARLDANAGSVNIPAGASGTYTYRISVQDLGQAVVASAPATLTVAATGGSTGAGTGCGLCHDAEEAIPALVPIIAQPIIAWLGGVLGDVASSVFAWVAAALL